MNDKNSVITITKDSKFWKREVSKYYADIYSKGFSYNDIARSPKLNKYMLTPQRINAHVKMWQKKMGGDTK